MNRRHILVTAVAVLAATGLSGCSTGLSASSSCRDYLKASAEEQNEAVSSIAADVGAQNAVTPLGRPNIDYLCAGSPSMTLGDAVRKTG